MSAAIEQIGETQDAQRFWRFYLKLSALDGLYHGLRAPPPASHADSQTARHGRAYGQF